jgi:hypothetical protein
MTDSSEEDKVVLLESDPEADRFYSGAYSRILNSIAVLGGVGTLTALVAFGWSTGLAFLLGAGVSYLNFLWLKQSMLALTNQVASLHDGTISAPKQSTMVFKFVFRYAVIGLALYAIMTGSSMNVAALIMGFFLFVLALFGETVVELVYGLRNDK